MELISQSLNVPMSKIEEAKARLEKFDKETMAPMQRERRRLKKAVHLAHGRRWSSEDNAKLLKLYRMSTSKELDDDMGKIAAASDRSVKASKFQLQKMLMTYLLFDETTKGRVSYIGRCMGKTDEELMDLLLLSFGGMTLDHLPPLEELRTLDFASHECLWGPVTEAEAPKAPEAPEANVIPQS